VVVAVQEYISCFKVINMKTSLKQQLTQRHFYSSHYVTVQGGLCSFLFIFFYFLKVNVRWKKVVCRRQLEMEGISVSVLFSPPLFPSADVAAAFTTGNVLTGGSMNNCPTNPICPHSRGQAPLPIPFRCSHSTSTAATDHMVLEAQRVTVHFAE
jgi:hypothetical protein